MEEREALNGVANTCQASDMGPPTSFTTSSLIVHPGQVLGMQWITIIRMKMTCKFLQYLTYSLVVDLEMLAIVLTQTN